LALRHKKGRPGAARQSTRGKGFLVPANSPAIETTGLHADD